MALMAETTENNAEKQQSHVKPSKGCCARCCACCIQCTSGFIFLLIIAMLVLCVRYFLELPVIINGFVNAAAFTQQTVASEMSNALNISSTATTIEPQNHSPDQVAHNETCQMFVCSFQHSNEVYQPEYNVSSSTKFQTKAAHIQTTLSAIFNTSLLKRAYRNSSVFLLRSDPFTIYTQLLFCNEEDTEGGITDDAVAQILRSYNGSLDISMSTQTVAVGGEAPCPMNSYLSGAWPWQVLIQEEQTAVCFGNVLTGFWLLSSADCLKNRVVSALSVVMISDSSSQNRIWNVSKVIQHPNFTASPTVNNFALIRLSKPIWFDSSIMPTCLPQTAQDPTVGSTCTATIGNVLDVSIAGLVNVNGTTASAISCLGVSQSGIIYITKTLSKLQISQMDLGNSLACLNTDSSVSLQGILSNSQDSSICIKYSSIGSAIEWIKSYILT